MERPGGEWEKWDRLRSRGVAGEVVGAEPAPVVTVPGEQDSDQGVWGVGLARWTEAQGGREGSPFFFLFLFFLFCFFP